MYFGKDIELETNFHNRIEKSQWYLTAAATIFTAIENFGKVNRLEGVCKESKNKLYNMHSIC